MVEDLNSMGAGVAGRYVSEGDEETAHEWLERFLYWKRRGISVRLVHLWQSALDYAAVTRRRDVCPVNTPNGGGL